jgi:hypothetical protein
LGRLMLESWKIACGISRTEILVDAAAVEGWRIWRWTKKLCSFVFTGTIYEREATHVCSRRMK